MKKFFKAFAKNNKGMTLVEILCAVAILGIVSSAISSAMVISARNYNRGSAEVEVQTEAQLVNNQISNLIIDASGDVTFEDNVLTINQSDAKYTITYNPEKQTIYYVTDEEGCEPGVLAEHVTSFDVDVSKYKETGYVTTKMSIEKNGRSFDASYGITSRNGNVEPSTINPFVVVDLAKIILEPHQEYTFTATTGGELTNPDVEWKIALNQDESTKINQDGKITIGKDETARTVFVTVSTKEESSPGVPKASATVKVNIRRVNDISTFGMCVEGIDKKSGAVYSIKSNIYGESLAKELGASYDTNYVNPYNVKWKIISSSFGLYEKISETDEEIKIKLKRDMNPGEQIAVTAIAEHPDGVNKTAQKYDDVRDTWHLISNFVFVELSDGGMKRNTNTKQGNFTQAFDDLAVNDLSKKYEYRFKTTDEEEWSTWYQNITGNANDNMEINLRPDVTAAMIYNKDYNVQIRISIIDKNGNTVWPTEGMSEDDYIIDAVMNRVSVSFSSSMLGFTDASMSAESKVITVQKGNAFDLFTFTKSVGYEENDIRNNLNYILEKYENGKWVGVPSSDVSVQKGPACKLKFEKDNRAGKYRVKVISEDMPKYTILESGEPKKLDEKEDFILYDESTGVGIFYFEVR